MKNISCILLFSICLYCCASTHLIKRDQLAYDEVNKKLKYKNCEITLNNNKVYKGRDINIGIDTSSWIESYARGTYVTAKERMVATSKIKYIRDLKIKMLKSKPTLSVDPLLDVIEKSVQSVNSVKPI